MIQIRDEAGDLLASGNTLDEAISELINQHTKLRAAVEARREEMFALFASDPDLTAIAPRHRMGFRSGWNKFRDQVRMIGI